MAEIRRERADEEARIEKVLKSGGIDGSLEPDYEAAISDIADALGVPVIQVRQTAIAGRTGRRMKRAPHEGANLRAALIDARNQAPGAARKRRR